LFLNDSNESLNIEYTQMIKLLNNADFEFNDKMETFEVYLKLFDNNNCKNDYRVDLNEKFLLTFEMNYKQLRLINTLNGDLNCVIQLNAISHCVDANRILKQNLKINFNIYDKCLENSNRFFFYC
jgi:hypothetical protein